MGRERLKAELLQRGFEESVTERALRKAYQSISEQELACQALEGRVRRTRPLSGCDFCGNAGFDDDTIQQVTQVDLEAGLDETMSQNVNDLRRAFIQYFEQQGHQAVPSAPLIPQADPTLLFTNAGMNQFKGVFLGEDTRAVQPRRDGTEVLAGRRQA